MWHRAPHCPHAASSALITSCAHHKNRSCLLKCVSGPLHIQFHPTGAVPADCSAPSPFLATSSTSFKKTFPASPSLTSRAAGDAHSGHPVAMYRVHARDYHVHTCPGPQTPGPPSSVPCGPPQGQARSPPSASSGCVKNQMESGGSRWTPRKLCSPSTCPGSRPIGRAGWSRGANGNPAGQARKRLSENQAKR